MSLQGVFKPAESPFFGIFEQDRVPSLDERNIIKELVAEKTAHLSELNSQVPKRRVGKKQRVPSELRVELAYTRRWLEFHRALVSPWRRLPPETMSEIFVFTLKRRGDHQDPWDDDRAGTLLVCAVCSTWRAIALRTPALWNILSIRLITERRARPEMISTWLERSRSLPVHLQLLWNFKTSSRSISSVMSGFATHFQHTAELSINGLGQMTHGYHASNFNPPLTFSPPAGSLDAPILSTVAVHLPPGSIWKWMDATFRAAPRLTHLSTSRPSLDLLPLANLTQLNWTHEAPMAQVFQMFEATPPNLTHVNIHVVGPTMPSSPKSRLAMKSITKLELTSREHLHEFLTQSEFPNLVNLRICDVVGTWPGPSFHSFLSRSSCALAVLAFHRCHISATELVACLNHSACTTLESLTVQRCLLRSAERLLRHLTYGGPEDRCANPNLRSITLRDISAPDGLLADMVESRCPANLPCGPPGPVPLTEIVFSLMGLVRRTDHAKDLNRLREVERTVKELKIVWPA